MSSGEQPQASGEPPLAGHEEENVGYTIDELAAASGVPTRTVRFYREIGLVEPPRRVGRHAYYERAQLDRLRLVADLRERGLALDAVAEVVHNPVAGRRALVRLMRVGDELRSPWTEDQRTRMTRSEVLDAIGPELAGALPIFERFNIIVRSPGARPVTYDVPSPAALELAGQLAAKGVTPDLAAEAWNLLMGSMHDVSRELVALFADHTGAGFAGAATPEEITTAFHELQAVALQAIQLAFARQITDALEEFVEHGGVFEATRRVRQRD